MYHSLIVKSESAQRGWYVEGTGTDLDWNIHLTKPNVDTLKEWC